jgi:hypothetical protein
MFADGLRCERNQPIFSARIPIACRNNFNAIANRFADARRHAGAGAAFGDFNSATDPGSNAATDGASDFGGSGQDHEFRVHPFQS